MDGLNRLTEWGNEIYQNMQLQSTDSRSWTLDSLGNDLAAGSYNAANEMTPTAGSSGYDAAGNMTTLKSGLTAKYDAWNRLVELTDGETVTEKYEYDGTGRRIQIFSDFDGTTPEKVVDNYLNGQQVIESDITVDGERAGGYQYLWSPRYIDAPILRDTLNAAGTATVPASRIFYLADANYNVTAIVGKVADQWQVVERYTYDPYGVVTVRSANGSALALNLSQFDNTTLYTGRDYNFTTGLYFNRARYYDPALQRFINRDPIGYRGGIDLYEYVGDNPVVRNDPTGLKQVCGFYAWLYAGSGIIPDLTFCVDESIYNAAIAAAGDVVNCWWNCEVTTHKCVGGQLLTVTEVTSGVLSLPGVTIPKLPEQIFNIADRDRGLLRALARKFGWRQAEMMIRSMSRNRLLMIGAKTTFVTAMIVEAGISVKCGYSCGKQNGASHPFYFF